MSEYTQMADDFCTKHGVSIIIKRGENHKPPITDGIGYRVEIKRIVNGQLRQYSFDFSDSVYNKEHGLQPTNYDILACLEKYEIGDFEDFCSEFGYPMTDDWGRINKENKKIYNACVKEWYNVRRMFDDCLDELREIN